MNLEDEQIISSYKNKSDDEIKQILKKNPLLDESLFDAAVLEAVCLSLHISVDGYDGLIDYICNLIRKRLFTIQKQCKKNDTNISEENTDIKVIQSNVTHESHRGGIIFLCILLGLFGWGWYEDEKEKNEREAEQQEFEYYHQQRIRNREFEERERQREKENKYGSDSSSSDYKSDSYDDGYDDAYSGDYDQDRYDNDDDYADGVEDAFSDEE